ncbi:MAG: hypothetical protein P8Y66_07610 [Nitrospirota bacterium]
MAEVRIQIEAEDRATPVFEALAESARGLLAETASGFEALGRKIEKKRTLTLGVEAAMAGVGALRGALASLPLERTLALDAGPALLQVAELRAALAAIPDVSYKDVVVRYHVQASPVMPFSEGIEHVRSLMKSLPRESDYVLRVRREGLSPSGGSAPVQVAPATFAPTVNVSVPEGRGGGDIARRIDVELARLWRHDRSELKRAMRSA